MSVSKELRFKDVDGKETTIEFAVNAENIQESNFTEAKVRENLKSGENLTKMLGKLAKWFTDLSKLAWSGKWADVGDKPGIGDLEGTLGVEKGGTGATSASDARTNLGIGAAATYPIADNDTTNNANYVPTARIVYEHGKEIDALSRDLNQRFPDGTGLQWDGTNFWGTTADGMKVKLGSLTYRDFTVTPTANSGSMSIDISDIPNYKDLILWETLFPRMLSDLDMANWNTSMLRTGVGYDWNYNADKGILSISSRHTECVLIQYGTGLKQRTVRVHYI